MSQFTEIVWKGLRAVFPLLILAAGVGGFLVFGQKPKPPEKANAGDKLPSVRTEPIDPHTTGFTIEIDGLAVSHRQVTRAAEVAGRITEKSPSARAGEPVDKEQFLVRINPRDYELEVERLTQEVQRKQQAIDELKTEITNTDSLKALAEKDFQVRTEELGRMKDLFKRGGLSRTDMEQAYRNTLNAENALQLLDNQLRLLKIREGGLALDKKSAELQLEKAQLDKDRTEVLSEVDGVVIRESVQKNDYVQKGQELFVIEDTSKVEVQASLRLQELRWIWASRSESKGSPYRLPSLDAEIHYTLDDRTTTWPAKLARYEGLGLEEQTRMAPVRFVVEDPHLPNETESDSTSSSFMSEAPPALLPGMFVTVRIPIRPQTKLLSIPEAGIRPGNQVWLSRKGEVRLRTVKVVQVIPGKVLVLAESVDIDHEQDRVIVTPLPVVRDGMKVEEE